MYAIQHLQTTFLKNKEKNRFSIDISLTVSKKKEKKTNETSLVEEKFLDVQQINYKKCNTVFFCFLNDSNLKNFVQFYP